MKRNDIDLDVAALIKNVPEDDVVFYFRAGTSDEQDFLYAKGDLADMGATLANMMHQNEDLELMIAHAVKTFRE